MSSGEPAGDRAPAYFVLPVEQQSGTMLSGLRDAEVDLVVVGYAAAALQGGPKVGGPLDIIPRPTSENIGRLLCWLLAHDAYDPLANPDRTVRPTEAMLRGGIARLHTRLGKVRVLAYSLEAYVDLLKDTVFVAPDTLPLTSPSVPASELDGLTILPVHWSPRP